MRGNTVSLVTGLSVHMPMLFRIHSWVFCNFKYAGNSVIMWSYKDALTLIFIRPEVHPHASHL